MTEIEATSDPVRLSWLQAILLDAGIVAFVFDAHSPWPGAFARRLLVAEDDVELARRIIAAAEPE